MQFSLGKLMVAIAVCSVLLAITFVLPIGLSLTLQTLIAALIVPPFVVVGSVMCHGRRKAFFLGAAGAGLPHFIVSIYLVCALGMTLVMGGGLESLYEEVAGETEGYWWVRCGHLMFYCVGLTGAAMGILAHRLLVKPQSRDVAAPQIEEESTIVPVPHIQETSDEKSNRSNLVD